MKKYTLGILALISLIIVIFLATKPNASNLLKEGELHYKKGNLKKAVSFLEQASELSENSFKAHYLLGKAKEGLGDIDGAIHHIEKASTLKPKHTEVHYNLAILYRATNDNKKAIEELEEAVKLEPNFVGAKLVLAKIYVETNRDVNAIQLFEQLSRSITSIDKEVINIELAKLYLKNELFDKAKTKINEVLKKNPQNQEALRLQKQLK